MSVMEDDRFALKALRSSYLRYIEKVFTNREPELIYNLFMTDYYNGIQQKKPF